MAKKFLWAVIILAVLLTAADPIRMVRFSVINKSGMDIGFWLWGQTQDEYYYLTIPKGDRGHPTEKSFTIVPDLYQLRLTYIETWDPVYGFQCYPLPPVTLSLTNNTRMTVIECGRKPGRPGEPSMLKFWIWHFKYLF